MCNEYNGSHGDGVQGRSQERACTRRLRCIQGAGYADEAYVRAGARLAPDAAALFGTAVAVRAESATLVEFGTRSRELTLPRGTSVLRMIDHKGMREEADKQMKALQIGIRSMSQAVETLSGGQRQGVAVARSAAFGSCSGA